MQFLKLRLLPCYSLFNSNSLRFSLFSFSTTSKESPFLDSLVYSCFKSTKSQSIYISERISRNTAPQKALSVINFFKQMGFSETQIHAMIRGRAQILFSDVCKTLKPKVEIFQQLGFQGSELGDFLAKNPTILTASLSKTLVPSVEAIRKIVSNENELVQVLSKCGWILPKYQIFMSNIAFLESYGIVGNQVLILLKRQSRLLASPQSTIRSYILQAFELGFPQNSRMLIHVLHTICGLSPKTLWKKLDCIQCFGFSKDESMQMFKKAPALLRTSEKKLKAGIEFYLHTAMLPKSALVGRPMILMYSIEHRVIPRYRVFQLLKSQNLCNKKVPSFVSMLCLSEDMFMDKFISSFKENGKTLLMAYKGHPLAAQ